MGERSRRTPLFRNHGRKDEGQLGEWDSVSEGPQHRCRTLVLGCGHLRACLHGRTILVSFLGSFLFSPSSRRFVVSGEKKKGKTIRSECKTTGL